MKTRYALLLFQNDIKDLGRIWEEKGDENQANNVGMFKLWKAMMKSKPKSDSNNPGSLPKVVNSRWREYQENGSPGYHIGEGRNIVKFAQFIRRYFADPANWGELIQVTFENSD